MAAPGNKCFGLSRGGWRFHNNQMIQPLNQCVITLWQLVPMAAKVNLLSGTRAAPTNVTNVTNVTNDCCSFGIIDHLSDATPRFYPLSMVQYWFCMVLLALSPLELSISVPSSPGSGGAQAPQSPIPTPDPPTARRSRVYLAGLVPRKKGLVIYP